MPASATKNRTTNPKNAEELAKVVRDCVDTRTPLIDYGIAHESLGHAPPAEHTKLVQRRHGSGIIEHYDRDLIVRAAAGARIRDLNKALKKKDQFLPIDADDDMTLGEAINHNVYGPLRVRYGSIRDLLLGLGYIDGEGRDVRVGGRTVKNVAGYDLTRFMVGGLGEMGIVHEATVRTYAIPKQTVTVTIKTDAPSRMDEQLTEWMISPAAPTHLAMHFDDGDWLIQVGYHGSNNSCEAQYEALRRLALAAAASGPFNIIDTLHQSFAEDHASRIEWQRWRREATALVKIIVPPSQTGAMCEKIAKWNQEKLSIRALPVHGCIFAGGDVDAAELDGLIGDSIRMWYARPDSIAPFGPPQADWPMLQRLKNTMDPHGILNPSRFLKVK